MFLRAVGDARGRGRGHLAYVAEAGAARGLSTSGQRTLHSVSKSYTTCASAGAMHGTVHDPTASPATVLDGTARDPYT